MVEVDCDCDCDCDCDYEYDAYILVHQAGLADSAVTEDYDLEQDLLAGRHSGVEVRYAGFRVEGGAGRNARRERWQ